MSWLPSAASPPIIPTHRVPPFQHISPTTSSLNRQFSSTSNHPSAAATAISSPSSPLPLSSQQNVSQSPSPSPNPAFSDLAEASTISPSSSPGSVNSDRSGSNSAANSNPVVSTVPSPHILNPLNVHPTTTRAKNGIVQPKIHPTLLLTHMEPTTVKQALASPHWFQAMQEEYQALLKNQTWTLVNMSTANGMPTPMISSSKLSKVGSHTLSDPTQFRSIVGALQYATLTRPELSFSVNKWADALTKPLSAAKFLPLRDKLRVFNKRCLIEAPSSSKGEY
ncbi:hypothetical protein KIW84_070123 [Lathyrus oleraceus]|uniref:Uncharacterized protein n=1 Tax=Pisum sativum TaxID=3888 RepID=A0A9D4VFV7_PEA|nr:hypothetical protein KIW84_070123 [Pisum sativum]